MVFVYIQCDNSFELLIGRTFIVEVQGFNPRVKDLKEQIKCSVNELEKYEINIIHRGQKLGNMDFLLDLTMEDNDSIQVTIENLTQNSEKIDCIIM